MKLLQSILPGVRALGRHSCVGLFLGVAFALGWAVPLSGATFIWLGVGPNNLFSTAANWDSAPPNDGTAELVFGATPRLGPVVDSSFSALGLRFSNAAGAYIFSGSPLTIGSAGILNQDGDRQTFSNNLVLAASQTWHAQGGDLLAIGTLALGSNLLTLRGPKRVDLAGAISGSGGITFRDGVISLLEGANTYTGSTVISGANSGADVSFSSAAQFGGGGAIALNQNGTLRLLDQGGGVVTLPNSFTWNGNRYSSASSPVIEVVGADDQLVLTSLIALTDRGGVVKDGQGTLRYTPATLASDSRWSLAINEGVVAMNQLPYRSGQNNNQGQPTGDLEFTGDSTLRMVFDSAINASLPSMTGNVGRYGYGFANIRVFSGVTGVIEVESGALFKTTGRTDTNNAFLGNHSTLVLDGADLTSQFQFGVGNSGGTINETFVNRTVELRGGTLSFFGVDKTFWPQTADFTMKLNGGE